MQREKIYMKTEAVRRRGWIAAAAFACVMLLTGRTTEASTRTLTFTESGVEASSTADSFAISGSTLTIKDSGVFYITGSCSDGSIVVNSGVSGATLYLSDLSLSASSTAPVVIKKNSSVTMHLDGKNTLTDAETDTTSTDYEGAAVKVKSGSHLTICGDGSLTAACSLKNGIKGAAESSLTVNGGDISVKAGSNGIAFDGSIEVNKGTITVDAGNDAIKAVPDEGDTASAGTIVINGGTFALTSDGDGIQAGTALTIEAGTFDITTFGGYNASGFDSSTMSSKGLKASGENDSTGESNVITINGGDFVLNTRDDAIHSDGYVLLLGGSFTIDTGDDGVHADTALTLGTDGGYERDPYVVIRHSYEGLEAGTVYGYAGKYYVIASDDGINAAGGSGSGSDPGQGGGNTFNPGGGPGGPGSSRPGMKSGASSDSYAIYISGGSYYVNSDGDGLDSNGGLYLYGGDVTVLSQEAGHDNSPLDADGTILLKGGTVFAAGSNPMNENPSSGSQTYKVLSGSYYSAGTVIAVTNAGTVMRNEKLLKRSNYILFSSPDMNSGYAMAASSALNACRSNAVTGHSWSSGNVSGSLMVYTCSSCGAVERSTVPAKAATAACVHVPDEDSEETEETVYTATFATNGHVSVNLYYTHDYTSPDETGAETAIARNDSTGAADASGDGQINFAVVPEDGYVLTGDPVVEGSYKNLKNVSTDALPHLYRITKVGSDLTVTVTVEAESAESSASEAESTDSGSESSASEAESTDSGSESSASETESTDSGSESSASEAESTAESTVSLTNVQSRISSQKNDGDLAGSRFSLLQAKAVAKSKTQIRVSWKKISGATSYIVYANRCGTKYKLKKVATLKSTKTSLLRKKLKKGTYYKFLVVAVKGNQVLSTSKVLHAATLGGTYGNYKSVTVNRKTLKMKVGAVKKITAKAKKGSLPVKQHRAVKYESSDPSVATVTAAGRVKAVGSGTCYIYAYAQNGVFARTKVVVS